MPPRRRPSGNHRWALLAAAALVAVALLAVLLPQTLDRGQQASPPPSTVPSGSAGAGGGTGGNPASTGPGGAASSGASGKGTTPGGGGRSTAAPSRSAPPSGQLPAGFVRYRDPRRGFVVAIPVGWTPGPGRTAAQVRFDDPNSARYLMIETSDSPEPDPLQNWIEYEAWFSSQRSNYENLGIKSVDYGSDKGWETADWEFRIGSTHVLNRNVLVSSRRAHAIYWSTPESLWGTAESRRIFSVAAASFVPAPVT